MSVSTTENRIGHTGDGVTTVFPFPYLFLANADIQVSVAGVPQTVGFTVTGAGSSSGGNVTFTAPPAIDAAIVLYRDPDSLQNTVLSPNDKFPSKSVETMVDKAMLSIQRLRDLFSRTLQLSDTDASANTVLPPAAQRANKLLSFDASGNAVATAYSDQSATALTVALAASGGAGMLGWIQGGVGAVLRFVQEKLRAMRISVKDYGAVGDNVADDTAAIQKALDYAATFLFKRAVYLEDGCKYRFTTLNVPSSVTLKADGGQNWSAVLYHVDLTKNGIVLNSRARIIDVTIETSNSDRVNPVAAPATILCKGSYPEVKNIRFQDAYIGVETDPASGAAVVADRLFGFVHHRMVKLNVTKDISYIDNLHSQNPDGVAWDHGWYSWNNKILVETNDCDGIFGNNWYTFGGKALFSRTGGGNLLTSVTTFGAESVKYGVFIDDGGATGNEHPVEFQNGYFQTNNRSDGVALLYLNVTGGEYHFSNVHLGQSIGRSNADVVPYLDQTGGNVVMDRIYAIGSNFTTMFKKDANGILTVTKGNFTGNFLKLFDFPAGAKNVFFDESNYVFLTDNSRFTLSAVLGLVNSKVAIGARAGSTVDGVKTALQEFIDSYDVQKRLRTYFSIDATVGSPVFRQTGLASDGTTNRYSYVQSEILNTAPASYEQRFVFSAYKQGVTPNPVYINSSGTIGSGAVIPNADNAYTLGNGSFRFSTVFAATGAINTSDEREKTDITRSVPGLSFISLLNPSTYKWKVGGVEVVRQVYVDLEGNEAPEGTELPDGATPGRIITKDRPGTRTHWGLIAQEVKAACDTLGIDFGGWVLVDKDNPESRQALRYDQFIPPLIKAVQELNARLAALEAK